MAHLSSLHQNSNSQSQSAARRRRPTSDSPAMVEASQGKVAGRVSLTESCGGRQGFQRRRSAQCDGVGGREMRRLAAARKRREIRNPCSPYVARGPRCGRGSQSGARTWTPAVPGGQGEATPPHWAFLERPIPRLCRSDWRGAPQATETRACVVRSQPVAWCGSLRAYKRNRFCFASREEQQASRGSSAKGEAVKVRSPSPSPALLLLLAFLRLLSPKPP